LPIPWRQEATYVEDGVLRGGYAGGWFHPTTGYSLPAAVRFASTAALSPADELHSRIGRLARSLQRQSRFFRLLNWMLFLGFDPLDRWRVLERFHQLPTPTIARFYAMHLTPVDRGRILCGRPPSGFSLRALLATRQEP
jgi:lycopene beta-cyclase